MQPSASPQSQTQVPSATGPTCYIYDAYVACAKTTPLPANASDFSTACAHEKTYRGNLNSCVYASTQFGDACTFDECASDPTYCWVGQIDYYNAELTQAAIALSGGLNGSCAYTTCQQACAAIAPSPFSPTSVPTSMSPTSAGHLSSVSCVGIVAAVMGWSFI